MRDIYLDNSATTHPFPEVIDLISSIQDQAYGNPSSMHEKGIEAEKLIKGARKEIAHFFTGREEEIIFTSGGTESNNLAIKGAAFRHRQRGNHLVTTEAEHPSVLNSFRFLETEGFEVTFLPVDSSGLVNLADLKAAIGEETTLVSIMHVNNEIGTIQPLEQLGSSIKEINPHTMFHIDAVQSFVKLPLSPSKWQADLISCSAHKIHGPKGVGCLWIKKNTHLQPLMHGGGQERGLRPGTENSSAIAAFGLAAKLYHEALRKNDKFNELKRILISKLKERAVIFEINGPPVDEGAPNIINLSVTGLKAEVMLHALEDRGIYVSAGSACHAKHPDPSHILEAIGLSGKRLESALRFSFSFMNTQEEMEIAAEAVQEIISRFGTL
ncbi:MAG: cysteine desulfurase family protein [Bacillota bacterium]|nr:cysteine desulfurase family protein [Bacillota bacterium]